MTEPRRLLVVDDDGATRLLLDRLFSRHGWSVTTAETGSSALARAEATAFDAILIDCHLPDMDGAAVARAVRHLEPPSGSAPLIGLSAGNAERERPSCLRAGMNDYVPKPFSLAELEARVEHWMPRESGVVARLPEAERRRPALDWQHLERQLAALGGVESSTGRAVLRTFLVGCHRRCRELDEAERSGSTAAAVRAAHALRGAAGNLGAAELAEQAQRLEEACRDGARLSPEGIARLVAAVDRCAQALRQRDRAPLAKTCA